MVGHGRSGFPGARRAWAACVVVALSLGGCGGDAGPDGPSDAAGGADLRPADAPPPADALDGAAAPLDAAADVGADVAADDDAGRQGRDAGPDVPAEPPGTVRFVYVSDLHVRGAPEAPSKRHLELAVDELNALEFPADFLVATGDFVEWLPEGLEADSPSNLHLALDEVARLRWPVRTTVGNHEYYRDGALQPTVDKEARDALLAAVLGHPLDEAQVVNGVRVVLLNSMAGDLWEANAGLVGSFTDEQLGWLRAELADGRPTLLFNHHPPAPGVRTASGDSLCDVIESNPGVVKAIFAGHLHGFWKGDFCGVPYYLVSNVVPGRAFYYLVEFDGGEDTLTVVNEADLPFGDLPELTCEPDSGGFEDPSVAVGSHQVLRVGSMVSNLPGLEGFEGDALDDSPFVVRVDAWEAASETLRAHLTMGQTQAGFVARLPGAPCLEFDLDVSGPCVVSDSQRFELDIVPLLETLLSEPIDPSWQVRLDIESLWLEARMGVDGHGAPVLEEGLLHLSGTGTGALDDLRGILVTEYCAGRLAGCLPGSGDRFPTCDGAEGPAFFDRIPASCDTQVGGMPLRFIATFLASYPLDNVVLVAAFHTENRPTSATPADGAVDEALFSTEAGASCGD